MDETQKIVITTADIEARRKFISPQEQILNLLSSQANGIAKNNLAQADTLEDFLDWHRVCLWTQPQYIGWILDIKPDVTPQEVIAEQRLLNSKKEAGLVNDLKSKLDGSPASSDHVRVVLKRVRDKSGDDWTYRALGEFPPGANISDPVLENSPDPQKPTLIYFTPQSACVSHACDDLYKQAKETSGIVTLPNLSVVEATQQLQVSPGGMAEYIISSSSEGVIKQDGSIQLLVGLLGGYRNEQQRVRVSDFLNQSKK